MSKNPLKQALVPLSFALSAAAAALGCASKPLTVGSAAPDFRLPATDDREIALADFRDKQRVVLAFYPMAFTPG